MLQLCRMQYIEQSVIIDEYIFMIEIDKCFVRYYIGPPLDYPDWLMAILRNLLAEP